MTTITFFKVIMSTGATTLVCYKLMRALGKHDYGDIIKFAGYAIIGLNAIVWAKTIVDNSIVINGIAKVLDFFRGI